MILDFIKYAVFFSSFSLCGSFDQHVVQLTERNNYKSKKRIRRTRKICYIGAVDQVVICCFDARRMYHQ